MSEFEALAPSWALDRSPWRPGTRRTRVLNFAGRQEWAHRAQAAEARRFVARCAPALVYVNSIASAESWAMLEADAPLLTHVHELEFSFVMLAGPELPRMMARTDRFIACSQAVNKNLTERHEIPRSKVEIVYEAIPVREIRAQRTRNEVLQELRVPTDAVLIAAGGFMQWRKAQELFVQLARDVYRQNNRVYFVWIGGGSSEHVAEFEHDVRLTGLGDRMRRTGAVANPADYLGAADVFVLTSREDPYPLICLEAAALGKPIVCFADAGGIPEFVVADCGYVVPYLDMAAMAVKVIALAECPEQRQAMGLAAKRKVARHDIETTGPKILDIIERTIASNRG